MKTIINFIKKNKNIILLSLSFIFLTILILGITYAYLDIKDSGETESTMVIGGAEISATYSYSNSIYISDAIPIDNPIATKDFSITYKNTSNEEYKIYLKAVIDYNTFTDVENEGVLYYDIYNKTTSTTIQDKTMFPIISGEKTILKEITIPAKSTTTINYQMNFYFPKSDKLQNSDKQLSLNAYISIENDTSLEYIPTAVNFIKDLYNSDASTNGLEIDDTPDNNLRYTGSDARNYVMFNDEVWRIIGVFNQIDANNNYIKQVVKIIKDGPEYSTQWDENSISNWNTSSLKKLLDNEYYNSISASYKNMILKNIWNTGSYNATTENDTARGVYIQERDKEVYTGYDYLSTGYIAIPYASDYFFASTNEICRVKSNTCNVTENSWMSNYTNAWLLNTDVSVDIAAYDINKTKLDFTEAEAEFNVYPTLYLNNNVRIADGDGTSDNPFILSK